MKHSDQVLALLAKQIGNVNEVKEIKETASAVVRKWVNPLSGGKEETNGLIYGLVQSGKTGVLTVTGAMGADEGYRTIIILTSDNDPLYDQTLGRVQEAFPGIDIIGKKDFKDAEAFLQRVKHGTCAIVSTKNSSLLKTLIQNFKTEKVRGLTCLIIDDEADQASLNTRERRADGTKSAINDAIAELRGFFDKTTYLQVTATPQALFLQPPGHEFRPKFTVLSHPGKDYVGGEDFFGDTSVLVREFDLNDITAMAPGSQPSPYGVLIDNFGRYKVKANRENLAPGDTEVKFEATPTLPLPRRTFVLAGPINFESFALSIVVTHQDGAGFKVHGAQAGNASNQGFWFLAIEPAQ